MIESHKLLVTAVGSRPKLPTCAAICRLRRVAPGPLRLALADPSIDRRSVGRREGSVCYVEERS